MATQDQSEPGARRVAICVSSLRCGGAERAASGLAGHLARRGHRISLATVDGVASDFHRLDPAVKRVALDMAGPSAGAHRALAANRRRIRALREALLAEEPDLVLSFILRMSVLAAEALRGSDVPLVVSERIDPRRQPLPFPWRFLGRRAYRRAARIVPNSFTVAEWMAPRHAPGRVTWIPNMVEVPASIAAPELPDGALPAGRMLLAVGRLAPQKGHVDLALAFAAARAARDWTLVIVGEGRERARLERLGTELGLGARLRLPGQVADPWPLYARADAFVLPSRYEGFPNALLEAMALGLPVLATDTGSGANELIADGENGLLVPAGDGQGLVNALGGLLGDERLRARLGREARSVGERFAPEAIVPRWEAMLEEVVAR